jgi:hypothetical protein
MGKIQWLLKRISRMNDNSKWAIFGKQNCEDKRREEERREEKRSDPSSDNGGWGSTGSATKNATTSVATTRARLEGGLNHSAPL